MPGTSLSSARRTTLKLGMGAAAGLALSPLRVWSAPSGELVVVSHPAVTVAIPCTARPDYLVDNLGVARALVPDSAVRARMAALIAGA